MKKDPTLFEGIWGTPQPTWTETKFEAEYNQNSHDIVDPITKCFERIDKARQTWDPKRSAYPAEPSSVSEEFIIADFEKRRANCAALDEEVLLIEDQIIEDYRWEEFGIYWPTFSDSPVPRQSRWYRQIYGSASAALFVLEGAIDETMSVLSSFAIPCFQRCFASNGMDANKLASALLSALRNKQSYRRKKALKAVSTAAEIYHNVPDTTIDVRSLQHDLSTMNWMSSYDFYSDRGGTVTHEPLLPSTLDLPSTFACLCFFESGRFNVETGSLQNVMAMSAGDAIWVAAPLLRAPYQTLRRRDTQGNELLAGYHNVIAFTGNIGQPGLRFLVPPQEPMIRSASIHDFRQILHKPFDGVATDQFKSTSLHLSFTSARSSISGYFKGLKDSELEIVETALSVHEQGEWVADLDVLKAIANPSLYNFLGKSNCPFCGLTNKGLVGVDEHGATAISNWTELLNPPDTKFSIVKAFDNWEARLAATVIAVATGQPAMVMPDHWCWSCMLHGSPTLDEGLILIG